MNTFTLTPTDYSIYYNKLLDSNDTMYREFNKPIDTNDPSGFNKLLKLFPTTIQLIIWIYIQDQYLDNLRDLYYINVTNIVYIVVSRQFQPGNNVPPEIIRETYSRIKLLQENCKCCILHKRNVPKTLFSNCATDNLDFAPLNCLRRIIYALDINSPTIIDVSKSCKCQCRQTIRLIINNNKLKIRNPFIHCPLYQNKLFGYLITKHKTLLELVYIRDPYNSAYIQKRQLLDSYLQEIELSDEQCPEFRNLEYMTRLNRVQLFS